MKDEGHLGEETLNMYLDDELSPEERGYVEAHLNVCDACRAQMLALQNLFIALDGLVPALAPDLVPGVLARTRRSRRLANLGMWLVPALQATATVVLLAWGWTQLAGYWQIVIGDLPPNTLEGIWTASVDWVVSQWAVLRTWPTAVWAGIQGLIACVPIPGELQFSPTQLVVLIATVATVWIIGNTLLLRCRLFNGQALHKEVSK
jgi:anti-sigma factor RsiW